MFPDNSYPCVHLNKVLSEKNNIMALNIVLESYDKEKLEDFPAPRIRDFEYCIKHSLMSFKFPEQPCQLEKQMIPVFVKRLAHCFCVLGVYCVADVLSHYKAACYLIRDFKLTRDEFEKVWDNFSIEYQYFIERTARFFCDSFFLP